MTGTHSVEVTDRGVKLNGEQVEHVRAVQYTGVVGEPPLLKMEVWAFDGVIKSEAIVHTTIIEHAPTSSSVVEFITSVDPAQLEAEVLGRMAWSEKTNGELILEVLRDWANDDST